MRLSILAAAVVALLIPASASASSHTCPSIHVQQPKLEVGVSVEHGSVSCKSAQRILDQFITGHGAKHGTSWTVDGWKCSYGKAGASCERGRASAQDKITGTIAG